MQKQPDSHARVLVVEDDPEMLMLAVTILQSLGHDVLEATDGTRALEVLETTADIDLLLTDIVMPGGVNGIALAKRAQAQYPRIKVFLMSGYAADVIAVEGGEESDLPLIRKPFRVADMADTLRSVLEA